MCYRLRTNKNTISYGSNLFDNHFTYNPEETEVVDMLELRERNEKKHVISDDETHAFAWAGYYSQHSNIFINGYEYTVIHVTDSAIEFNDGTILSPGCYAIFEREGEIRVYDDYKLRDIRKENPLKNQVYCFSDENFLKVV